MSNRHDEYVRAAGYELRNPDSPKLLVLLHGLGGDREQPLQMLGPTASNGFAILAPDARAHGATLLIGDESDFTFPSMAADVLALVHATKQSGKPTYLVGISMGAALALELVRTGALDVRGAAFVRPAFNDQALPANLTVMKHIADELEQHGTQEGLLRFLRSSEYRRIATASTSAAASLRQQFEKPQAFERRPRLAAVPNNIAYRTPSDLADITVPTVVVGAVDDPVHPVALARVWAEHLGNAEYEQVPSRDNDPDQYSEQMRDAVAVHIERTMR